MLDIFKKLVHLPSDREKQHLEPKVLKKILLQTAILPIVLMVFLSLLFVQQVYNLLDENQKVRNSDEMISIATLALKQTIDAETALRGFLLTGDEDFLVPWKDSNKQLPSTLTLLYNLNKDNRGQLELLEHIDKQYKQWQKSAVLSVELRRKTSNATNMIDFKLRKELIDDIRLSFEQFYQTENTYRLERWLKAENTSKIVIAVILILGVLLGVGLALFSTLQFKRLSLIYSGAFKSLSEATDILEQNVDLRNKELQNVNKELEAFSYSVSHDLRAPLRGIDGFSQILTEEYSEKLDGEALRYLGFIRQGVQTMGVLIDDLIKLSRLTRSEFKKEEVDIAILADELIKELTVPNPDRMVQFKNFESEIVIADAGLLRVALQNLISNAWKYSSTKELTLIECGKAEKDGLAAYFIRDNGVGFDMRFYDKLFQPFQRLHPKEKFDGTGIGLATVARIIRRHGGTIWAESVVGEGTTFFFTLDVK